MINDHAQNAFRGVGSNFADAYGVVPNVVVKPAPKPGGEARDPNERLSSVPVVVPVEQ